MIGDMWYRNTLQIRVQPEGLLLSQWWLFRIGHPPIFVPYASVIATRLAAPDAAMQQFWVAYDASMHFRMVLPRQLFTAVTNQLPEPEMSPLDTTIRPQVRRIGALMLVAGGMLWLGMLVFLF